MDISSVVLTQGLPMRTLLLAATVGSLACPAMLGAQQRAGAIQGTLREKIDSRSIRSASVSLVPVESESNATISIRPDAKGQFHLDSLPAGRYLVQVSSSTLDSLELSLPPQQLDIASGRTATFDFTLPSGATLRDAVCQGLKLGEGKAVVAGRAMNADTDRPLPGADVVAAWVHNAIDKNTLKVVTQVRGSSVKAGPNGEYRMCGVPSGVVLSLQLQYDGRAGTIVRLAVSDDEGAAVRDLSISPSTLPPATALDSVARVLAVDGRDSTREELKLVGTATLIGEVRSLTGEPVPDAEVRVRDARNAAVTDGAGRYTLSGLPSGTQLLVVRKLGYPLAEMPVELRPGRSATRDVLLRRNVVLDSVRVVAGRTEYPEFERNRRTNTFGQFLGIEEIDKMRVAEVADLFIDILGFTVLGRGTQARAISNQALARHPECRNARIYVNGSDGWLLNNFAPSQIAGIEAYADETFVPARYEGDSKCGLIVIWLRKPSAKPMAPMGLSGNGYP
jgi:hypothetical protein